MNMIYTWSLHYVVSATEVSTYSKALSYTALSCTDLADARFLIWESLRNMDLCSENLKLHVFLMILPYPY